MACCRGRGSTRQPSTSGIRHEDPPACRQGWIGAEQLERLALPLKKSGYGDDLVRLLQEKELTKQGLTEAVGAKVWR